MTDPAEIDLLNTRASVLMKHGIQQMSSPRVEDVHEAIRCFDQALAIRLRLPIERDPLLAYGLAACYLNRADALARLGPPAMAAAQQAYDEGIAVTSRLPLAVDPRFPRRLIIAHQNRGMARLTIDGDARRLAIADFETALSHLDASYAEAIEDRTHLRAVVCLNLATARAAIEPDGDGEAARAAARQAIALVAEREASDADAAEVSLKARHVVCQTLAATLSAPGLATGPLLEVVHEATDLADEGLALAAAWEQHGVSRFRDIACDLFRFGARVYDRYQPQFLREFIVEHTDPARSSPDFVATAAMRAAADEARALLRTD